MTRIVSDGTSQPNMHLCEVEILTQDKVIKIQYENEDQKEKILESLKNLGLKAKEVR